MSKYRIVEDGTTHEDSKIYKIERNGITKYAMISSQKNNTRFHDELLPGSNLEILYFDPEKKEVGDDFEIIYYNPKTTVEKNSFIC